MSISCESAAEMGRWLVGRGARRRNGGGRGGGAEAIVEKMPPAAAPLSKILHRAGESLEGCSHTRTVSEAEPISISWNSAMGERE